ncbi:Holliday junction resolvase RuvX [Acutalibacter sp. 1XD8-33]|uniref:Holliday junction resolvase RuvX n=1 Tax=Acutalibacter sp. 1XD8-33 TaxID=2320081 RepID=UPI000EA2E33B|nr:Holliday junction resolvase RuvX [Acutalibacter sp. 1XD8-33]RKJ39593.1 Holliday junction resolvase RuvX [Acutalibacter sp. 1XD8-33]
MIILGVDLGHARTGLAVCDKGELLASPLKVIAQRDPERLMEEVAAAAKEAGAELLAVGLPRNMDGTEGDSARFAREMGERLGALSGLPVEFVDERGTTITAHGYLNDTNTRGKKRKAVVDAVAAVIILEDFLRRRRNLSSPGE